MKRQRLSLNSRRRRIESVAWLIKGESAYALSFVREAKEWINDTLGSDNWTGAEMALLQDYRETLESIIRNRTEVTQ